LLLVVVAVAGETQRMALQHPADLIWKKDYAVHTANARIKLAKAFKVEVWAEEAEVSKAKVWVHVVRALAAKA
jgi:hypothetical protein